MSNAYQIIYKGVQLGDECFRWVSAPVVAPPRATAPLRSPGSFLDRPTAGAYYRHQFEVHILGRDFVRGPQLVESWASLANSEPGQLVMVRGSASAMTVDDAILLAPVAQPGPAPSYSRVLPVQIELWSPGPSR